MKVTAQVNYIGDLRTKSKHLQSGDELITDAPTDNRGKGEAFSPTDTVATALATCILTTIGIKASDSDFSIDGATADVVKIMANDPRRIAEVKIEFYFPANNYTEKQRKIIENTARTCPVARSLHPDLKQSLIFNY